MCNFECIAKIRDIFEEKLIFCGKEFQTSSNKNYSYVAINLTFSPFVAKKKKIAHFTILFALGASCADVRCRIRPRRGVQQVSEKKA